MFAPRIVISGNDQALVNSLKNFLLEEHRNYTIISLNSLQDLYITLITEKIDLLLLNLNVDDPNLIKLLKYLLNKNIWISTIILSGKKNTGETQNSIYEEYGVVDRLKIPINLEKLGKRIKEVIKILTKHQARETAKELQHDLNIKKEFFLIDGINILDISNLIPRMEIELQKVIKEPAADLIKGEIALMGFKASHFPRERDIDLIEKVGAKIKKKKKALTFKKEMIDYLKNKQDFIDESNFSPNISFIAFMEKELQKYKGNHANIIINNRIIKLGLYLTFYKIGFPPGREIELIEEICKEIQDRNHLIAFKRSMIGFLQNKQQISEAP